MIYIAQEEFSSPQAEFDNCNNAMLLRNEVVRLSAKAYTADAVIIRRATDSLLFFFAGFVFNPNPA